MDLLTQMLRMPFDMIAMSIEPFLRMAREAERSAALDGFRRPLALLPQASAASNGAPAALTPMALTPTVLPPAVLPPSTPIAAPAATLSPFAAAQRRDDLNDNLVKLVQYYIVFTRPDVERQIAGPLTEVINYPTTAEELSALLLLNYAATGGLDAIPAEDRRYVKLRLHVIEKYAVEDKYYDRRQTQAQEEIAQTLERGFGA